jgi:alcohol dehydrogenase
MIPRYYEFLNNVKIMSGYRALDNIPEELKSRGANRPILVTHKELIDQGMVNKLLKAMGESELMLGCIFQCSGAKAESNEQAINKFRENTCDSVIAMGDVSAFELGREILRGIKCELPLIAVPIASSGTEIAGNPDVVVLDPRLSYSISQRETTATAMDILCHAIEAYTCMQKNPLSDAYAFSAIKLVRENLDLALKSGRDRQARLGLANAALLSGMALMNSQPGIAHALAAGITDICDVSHPEAIGIVLPHCMDYNMIKLDEYYGELLLPLSGPEIYADTLHHERGRKAVQTIRNMLADYHSKYELPVCLSEIGVKRSDFDEITAASFRSSHVLYNPSEVNESDIKNVLHLAF